MELKYKPETIIRALDKRIEELEQRKKEDIERIINELKNYFDSIKPSLYQRLKSWFNNQKIEKDYSWISEVKNCLINNQKINLSFISIDYWDEIYFNDSATHVRITDTIQYNSWINKRKEQRDVVSRVDFKEIQLTDEEARNLNL